MRSISKKTHAKKESPPADDLFPVTGGKPLIGRFATAVQLLPFTALDDPALRRLAALENPHTHAPFIPKPVRARYDVPATLAGVTAWRIWQLDQRPDHPVYASMAEADTRGLIPKEFQQFALKQRIPFLHKNRNVASQPLRAFAADILRKLATGDATQIQGLDNAPQWNSDLELAKVRYEDARQRARENAVEEGTIHKLDRVEEILWEHGLSPLRAEFLRFQKVVLQQIKTELKKASVPADAIQTIDTILRDTITAILEKIRLSLPKKSSAPAEEKKSA